MEFVDVTRSKIRSTKSAGSGKKKKKLSEQPPTRESPRIKGLKERQAEFAAQSCSQGQAKQSVKATKQTYPNGLFAEDSDDGEDITVMESNVVKKASGADGMMVDGNAKRALSDDADEESEGEEEDVEIEAKVQLREKCIQTKKLRIQIHEIKDRNGDLTELVMLSESDPSVKIRAKRSFKHYSESSHPVEYLTELVEAIFYRDVNIDFLFGGTRDAGRPKVPEAILYQLKRCLKLRFPVKFEHDDPATGKAFDTIFYTYASRGRARKSRQEKAKKEKEKAKSMHVQDASNSGVVVKKEAVLDWIGKLDSGDPALDEIAEKIRVVRGE